MRKIFKTAVVCGLGIGFLTACQHNGTASLDLAGTSKMAAVEASQTQTIVNLKDVLDASAENIPTLKAVGYAVTSSQPGRGARSGRTDPWFAGGFKHNRD